MAIQAARTRPAGLSAGQLLLAALASTATGWLVLMVGGVAAAQVVERNLPPAPAPAAAPRLPTVPLAADQDDRPIGPPLVAVVALGPTEPVRSVAKAAGVQVANGLRLGAGDHQTALSRFLGRPISPKLIADIQAEISRIYRRDGHPFVSVSTPEQEISSGVLQLRVIEFLAGQVRATGGRRTPPAYVEGRVRVRTGDAIDAGDLSEDLDWLNRNPFRQVQPVFSPGQGLGRTDLNLEITEQRPFRVYGGYAQSGSQATGRDRYSLGGQLAGLPGLPDALSSYQFTGSYDAFGNAQPKYVSHAVRLDLPAWPRQALEFTFDRVESSQPVQDFVSRTLTQEAALGWRGALSNLPPARIARLRGDISLGVEARQSDHLLLFGGQAAQRSDADVFQLYAGYTGVFADRFGGTTLNATAHVSPGAIDSRDTDAVYRAVSMGRTSSARYAYLNGQIDRTTPLPRGLVMSSEVLAQYAGRALPDTEQTAIGGPGLVRGYSQDDGAFDTAVVIRDELRAPGLRLLADRARIADVLQLRVFFDAGWAYERVTRREVTALSAGVGADYQLGPQLQLGADLAWPLRRAPFTRAGECRVESRLTVGY